MPAGLFGKLPAKRDFISTRASMRFLGVWEPWLQAGLAQSRETMGSNWIEAFNRAPIWRFWLGADLCGEATIGAFMPSVDGVGRSFPLALFASGDDPAPPPPEVDPNNAWCEMAETVLLGALEPKAAFEDIARAAAELADPLLRPAEPPEPGVEETRDGEIFARDGAFAAIERFRRRKSLASRSFWWTIGGEDYPPIVLSAAGMPAPGRFAAMLTGAFGAAPTPSSETVHGA